MKKLYSVFLIPGFAAAALTIAPPASAHECISDDDCKGKPQRSFCGFFEAFGGGRCVAYSLLGEKCGGITGGRPAPRCLPELTCDDQTAKCEYPKEAAE